MRKARNNYYNSIITGILGFVIIGGSLNGNAPGEIANWPVTGAGLAVLSSSIFFYALQIKQTKKGIHHYNQGM